LLGRHKRFLWDSPELCAWIDQRIISSIPVEGKRQPVYHCEYLDSGQLAAHLNISETWVRDHVRARYKEPIPHVRFGKYVRFRWGGPELAIWLEHRMLSGTTGR
jgi:hypothetical protein